jgi:hypothetical protein
MLVSRYSYYEEEITVLTWLLNHAQPIAFVFALFYFAYKVVNGYLVVNTSIAVELVRSATSAATDMIAITVALERGQLGSLLLHDVRALASWQGGTQTIEFHENTRLSYEAVNVPTARKRALFNRLSSSSPLLRLAPGERASYGAWIEVPASVPCTVTAVALGRLVGGWRIGQWRASRAVLPRQFVSPGPGMAS